MSEADGFFSKPKTAPLPVAPRIDAEEYDMGHARRGVALIFNHVNFSHKADKRDGAELDAERSVGVFKSLGFEVKLFVDLTRRELFNRLEEGRVVET